MSRVAALTAADVSALSGRPLGTVYRLASEQKWRRYREGRVAFYALDDVEHMLVTTPTPKSL
ncbi:hypothetical protein Lfu02_75470 [Longispora fulva]|uniref:Helix-turn-helix domain-containing protein n=1 Tax=Longispora fulva TaxID=619741 RepID=A0A8J7GEN0_9ACTN|nr:hypothetical protein [Longispora fulva]MBG6136316.1 hypothetical protein [Longispora fulva]GIG63175.1 hypothetical protein Lfu02_75470 [Longispora fulva]